MSISKIIRYLRAKEPCYGCNAPSGRIQLYSRDGDRLALCRSIHEARKVARINGYELIEK